MALLSLLPLALVLSACLLLAVSPAIPALDRPLTRLALAVFGPVAGQSEARRERHERALRASHTAVTHRAYAAKTMLYSGAFAVAGAVVGVYLISGGLSILAIPPETIRATVPSQFEFLADVLVEPELDLGDLFSLLLVSSATTGVAAGALTYWFRWYLPTYRADARDRQVDASIARTIAFMYALSRSGMAFPEIMRTLADNRSVYGGAADEVAVAVREMELTGLDLLTAVQRMGERTASDTFEEFAENLASTLRSGRSVSAFLRDQYERHHEAAEARQEQFLQMLAALAEGYVSLFVVGPLLLITVLVIMGLMGVGNTERVLQLLIYLVVPLGTALFVIYLDGMTESLRVTHEAETARTTRFDHVRHVSDPDARRPTTSVEGDSARSDGGTNPARAGHANVERFRAHERLRWLRAELADPVRTVRDRPESLLYVTVPLALGAFLLRALLAFGQGTLDLRLADDLLLQSALFVLATFAAVQEVHRRRLSRLEAAVPDFLDRLANVNDAGMTIIASMGRVSQGDLGALTREVERTWEDVRLGADAETAFERMASRIRTPTMTRIVTLLTNAMHSSGNLGPVLRIAADDAQATRRLKRNRRQEMFTYLVVIYLSFLVFLVIIASLNWILIPNLPTQTVASGDAPVPGVGLGGNVLSASNVEGYTLLLYHTTLIQAVCSGLVAGQMGEESVKNGAKHATVMLIIAYAMFAFL